MRGKSALLMVLALGCGLGAMYGASQILSKPTGAAPEMAQVLVAARDLRLEEILKEDMIVVETRPKATLPPGTFDDAKLALGRWVKVQMFAGEMIVDPKLAPKGAPEGLVSKISPGKRAVAVEVNEQTGVSGFILPMHRVDVILNKSNQATGSPPAETLLQDVLILASGQTLTRTDDKSMNVRTVTVEVTPEEADELVAARARGTLSLSLRGMDDHKVLKRPEPKPETLAVVVAARDLAPREVIVPDMLRVEQIPRAVAPADAKSDPGAFLGRMPATSMAAGAPITESSLLSPASVKAREEDEAPPITGSIGPGMRPFFLTEDEMAGLAGHLRSGDHVDVLLTRVDAKSFAGPLPMAETIVHDAKVLTSKARAKPPEEAGEKGNRAAPSTPPPLPPPPVPPQVPADAFAQVATIAPSLNAAAAAKPAEATAEPRLAAWSGTAIEVSVADVHRLTSARAVGKLSLALRGADDRARWLPDFSSKIATGLRAFVIDADEQGGLSGTLSGKSRVDVLLARADVKAATGPLPMAETVVHDARVIAVGSRGEAANDDDPIPRGPLVIEVSVADAHRLATARALGKISLALRGDDDRGRWATESRAKDITIHRGPPGGQAATQVIPRSAAYSRYEVDRPGSLAKARKGPD